MEFRVKDVIEKVTENKEKHLADYEAAKQAYKQESLALLEKALADAKLGKFPETQFVSLPPKPKSYIPSYDRIISMLNLTSQKTVELSEQDYSKYILDNWEWKELFTSTSAYYMQRE